MEPVVDMETVVDMEAPVEPACADHPSSAIAPYANPNHEHYVECTELDPECELTIDILFIYTPFFFERLGYQTERVEQTVNRLIEDANKTLENSLLPRPYRYRVAGIESLAYTERGQLKSDVITLRMNPVVQSLKAVHGADVVFALLGTRSYGGLAYNTGSTFVSQRFIAAIDGYFLTDDYERCASAYSTFPHEVGHLLGAGHRASQYRNPNGIAYGYHNQETHLRRNQAYGIEIDQEDLLFYTLMSYKSYDSPEGNIRGCVDCQQLLVFSSPDLWWFDDPLDDLHGFCWVVNEHEGESAGMIERVDLLCGEDTEWMMDDGGGQEPRFTPPMSALTSILVENLVERAVPLGVDQPTYQDPNDPQSTIQEIFSARNRDRVIDRWPQVARLNPKPVLAEQCSIDCDAYGRGPCLGGDQCGPCLPDRSPHQSLTGEEICVSRLELHEGQPLHDQQYQVTQVLTAPSESLITVIPLISPSTVSKIEVTLSTLNDQLESDWAWVNIGPTTWVANAAPPHTMSLYAYCENDDQADLVEQQWGTTIGQEFAVRDGNSQNNHSLTYHFDPPSHERCHRLELHLSPWIDNAEGRSESEYTFSIDEIRVFGLTDN